MNPIPSTFHMKRHFNLWSKPYNSINSEYILCNYIEFIFKLKLIKKCLYVHRETRNTWNDWIGYDESNDDIMSINSEAAANEVTINDSLRVHLN